MLRDESHPGQPEESRIRDKINKYAPRITTKRCDLT